MKVILSTEDINSFGFWVKTNGIDLSRFKKNPVLTYIHRTDEMSVGKINNVRIEDNQLVGEVEFDAEDKKGKELARKYKKGYMRGFSIGFEPKSWSDNEKDLKPGQTVPTVLTSELIEIAAATVPSNQNAVVLYRNGKKVDLSTDGENSLPVINKNKMKKVIAKLNLADNATEKDVINAIEKIEADKQAAETAKVEADKKVKELSANAVDALIKTGKANGTVTDENEKTYRKLAANDFGLATEMITKVVPGKQSGKKELSLAEEIAKLAKGKNKDADKVKLLNDMTEAEVLELRKEDLKEYSKRFKLTYGITPSLE